MARALAPDESAELPAEVVALKQDGRGGLGPSRSAGATDRHRDGGEEGDGYERADARASFERGGEQAFEGRCASAPRPVTLVTLQ